MLQKPSLNQIIIFASILVVILLLVFPKESAPVYKVSPKKTIINRIESKEKDVDSALERAQVDQKLINSLLTQIGFIKAQLSAAKEYQDTVEIVKLQDIIIYKQDSTILNCQIMNLRKDSVIINQRYIIDSKDTLLTIADHQLKKVKKQRNRSLLINGIQTGIITGLIFWK